MHRQHLTSLVSEVYITDLEFLRKLHLSMNLKCFLLLCKLGVCLISVILNQNSFKLCHSYQIGLFLSL